MQFDSDSKPERRAVRHDRASCSPSTLAQYSRTQRTLSQLHAQTFRIHAFAHCFSLSLSQKKAYEASQKYKEGKFILEKALISEVISG